MAQNECQQMDKADFYKSLRNQISTLYNGMMALKRASEFLNTMDAETATNMGMDSVTRDTVADLRVAMNEMLDFYDGSATSQTMILKDEINNLRYI